MPSTRHAPEDGHLRQSRYASNDAFESGLLCNLVARRCKLVADPADRALLYFLQQLSHQEGGLDRVAAEFLAMFPERIGTPSLRQLKPGQEFSREQWEKVKREFGRQWCVRDYLAHLDNPEPTKSAKGWRHRIIPTSHFAEESTPTSPAESSDYWYPVDSPDQSEVEPTPRHQEPGPSRADLLADCQREAATHLAEMLWIICLDPESKLQSPYIEAKQPKFDGSWLTSWWFDDLLAALHLYRARCIAAAETAIAQTTISNRIFDDLDYMAHCQGLVVIEGDQRTGKSTAAKNWCDKHPGQAVYVKLGTGNDDATFFRSIAKALGTAASLVRKPTEMQMKIEDALQDGHLVLVLDEAHFLFAQTQRPRSAPSRLDWVRTALVDFKVGVALISTPQFERSCELYEKTLRWNAKQIKGRVKLHTILPTELPPEDLTAVARKMAPQASDSSLMRLVGFAQASDDYLAGIERLTQRAGFFASRDGREEASKDDIKRALDEATPRALAPAAAPAPAPRQRKRAARALPVQRACKARADTLQSPATGRTSQELSASPEAEFGACNRLHSAEAATSGYFAGAAASD